ncbi:hypothetical protein M9Y10_028358 [Tritrichomonas musculus]|uniref:Uncharacterized protein n=1 Tax=Tritrichomonas musculus TaxID=1915356 RepID=A0ABR2KL38_9EUKA
MITQNQNSWIFYGKVAVANPTLKWDDFWIQIKGYWLEISKKLGQACSFIIPLDLQSITAAFQETNVQNSIAIVTSQMTGSNKIYLQSTNRYDIIQMYHALQYGQSLMQTAFQKAQIPQTTEFDCETITSFFNIGKSKLRLIASPRGLEFTGNKTSTLYEYDKIHSVYAKLNDASADTRLCINVDENGSVVTKEFNCLSRQNLINAISCFMINTYIWKQNSSQAPNNGQPVPDLM